MKELTSQKMIEVLRSLKLNKQDPRIESHRRLPPMESHREEIDL